MFFSILQNIHHPMFNMAVGESGRPQAGDEEITAPFDTQSTGTTPTAVPEDDKIPRPDGGIGAWLFLAGASIIEIVAWVSSI